MGVFDDRDDGPSNGKGGLEIARADLVQVEFRPLRYPVQLSYLQMDAFCVHSRLEEWRSGLGDAGHDDLAKVPFDLRVLSGDTLRHDAGNPLVQVLIGPVRRR